MKRCWRISPNGFARFQLVCIGTLVVGCAFAYLMRDVGNHGSMYGFVPLFDVGNENGLATFFSVQNLLLAAFVTYMLAIDHRQMRSHRWKWLAYVFIYLALDEATSIHEKFDRLDVLLGSDSFIRSRHAWLLFGFPFALVSAAVFMPLLAQLPRVTAVQFLLAGAIFASGSLGFELLGSWMIDHGIRPYSLTYDLRRLTEETLEMSGIALYNWAAIRTLAVEHVTATLIATPNPTTASVSAENRTRPVCTNDHC